MPTVVVEPLTLVLPVTAKQALYPEMLDMDALVMDS